jgi:hypothetical protein
VELVALGDALELVSPKCDLDQLAGNVGLLRREVRRVTARDVAVETVRERRRLSDSPGHLEGLRRERSPLFGVGARVAKRAAREPREEPDAQVAVVVAESSERSLEQGHEVRVVARDVPDQPAAVAECRSGKLLGK